MHFGCIIITFGAHAVANARVIEGIAFRLGMSILKIVSILKGINSPRAAYLRAAKKYNYADICSFLV